uniref:[2Fe-2S] binding domain-containing protein n=1 Tax=Candidatus Kentrum sp. UNK TaxID=2126344 RepID=A0A451AFR2_9GAMM|nr:MAG: [2Fe-2S] binding domain-containing protein [Candidatus Kentron sp. UNK]VFK71276.1 MAG: [2Fe-2S] binding domain-containing protein [Candidatus Kentron sp. UNK]
MHRYPFAWGSAGFSASFPAAYGYLLRKVAGKALFCGSCLILVGETDGDAVSYWAINSCLLPLAEADGKHVVTIEGLNDRNNRALNPIQQAIMIEGATQCGYYCTPGIVLALTGYFLGNPYPDENEAIAAISGNLCRCTGYLREDGGCA